MSTKADTSKATRPGNYFISNYPPFSFWSENENSQVEAAYQQQSAPDVPLGLYHHIPFCRKRCHFCYFRVYTDKSADDIKGYLDSTLKELDMMARKPLIEGRKPEFIYFGGGTPSYLSAKQLRTLTDQMKAILPWDDAKEVAFECEPGTLNAGKLAAIKDIGVTRLSLGIENFDDHILEINGRAHRSKEVVRAYERAVAENFDQINIDLISGMIEETEENWQRNIEKTIELSPDSVTIYQMEIPYNTTIYREMKDAGKLIAPVADWATKRRWVKEAFAELESAGYTISSGYTAVKNPDKTKFIYRDSLWGGADLLGLGVASFSHAAGLHYQNFTEIDDYTKAINAGEMPTKRSFRTTTEQRMIREFILQMKLGRVEGSYFEEKFGVDVLSRWNEELGQLNSEGLLQVGDGAVSLSRDGLLCVDNILHDFFLPEHRTDQLV
ncbi:coproporphyrinogen III oxidase family protein [bacterium]|nr:coproporphyrinogen III oxidase family protein [Akkermansiaceae bacterium]MDA8972834.1 coproporphyrinogen III oxidase family protein [bacterium]MDA8980617.1 coproporphyrinogen III oxidase family protein [bacterium]MDB4422052.1 coproporphyrinogen III oxidase family protein [Akkermansiaceae bacterium]MDB4455730.1 coproporphyrinogen III oxidase family protein [bacterium]